MKISVFYLYANKDYTKQWKFWQEPNIMDFINHFTRQYPELKCVGKITIKKKLVK